MASLRPATRSPDARHDTARVTLFTPGVTPQAHGVEVADVPLLSEPAGPEPRRRILWITLESRLHSKRISQLLAPGCDIESASDGLTGLGLAAKGDRDVVVLDLAQSVSPGLRLLKELRCVTLAPVIVISRGAARVETAARILGATACVTDRLDDQAVVTLLRAVVSRATIAGHVSLFRPMVPFRVSVPVIDLIRQCERAVADVRPDPSAIAQQHWAATMSRALARVAADANVTFMEFAAVCDLLSSSHLSGSFVAATILEALRTRPGYLSLSGVANSRAFDVLTHLEAAGARWLYVTQREITDGAGLHRSSLWRLLDGHFGLTFPECKRTVGMRRAILQLASGDNYVSQVAYRLGYEHPSQFARTFAHFVGVSATDFRLLLK